MIDTQAIRTKILDLAMRGHLTERVPEDETANELMSRIQAEKQLLISAGKIRKEKTLSDITEDEKPFEIPENWTWVRLGTAFCVEMGQSPDGSSVSSSNEGIEFHQGKIFFGAKYINDSGQRTTRATKIAEPNSVLLCVRAPVGKVNITQRIICIGRGLCAIKPVAGVEVDFLYYALTMCEKAFVDQATGSTFAAIGGDIIKKQPVPLPPLTEQKRIVQKIEQAFSVLDTIDALQAQYANNLTVLTSKLIDAAIQGKLTEQLPEDGTAEELYQQIQAEKQALIKAGKIKRENPLPVINDIDVPFEIPANWKWVSVGDVCINIQYGSSQKSSPTGKMPVLRMGNIQSGKIVYDKLVYTSDDTEIAKYPLEKNDLLFNRTNSMELVGKTAIYKGERPAIYAGYLVRLTPLVMDSDYLNYAMQSKYYWDYCRIVRIDSNGQSNINAEKLKRFVFPLPPLAEQKRITARLEETLKMIGV